MNRPDNHKPIDWESYAEALIRAAQEEGEFDNLPGFGRPRPGSRHAAWLPGARGIDEPNDENWWVREKLKREGLKTPPPGSIPQPSIGP